MDLSRTCWYRSVVTRLVLCAWLAGVAMSLGLGWLEYDRSTRLAMVSTSQRLMMIANNTQHVLRPMLQARQNKALLNALEIFAQDPLVIGMRLLADDGAVFSSSDWPADASSVSVWTPAAGSSQPQMQIEWDKPTMLIWPFVEGDRKHTLEILVNGPMIISQMRTGLIERVCGLWLMLGMLMLLGLLLLRRWLVAPLTRIVDLAKADGQARHFEQAAAGSGDEFGDLSHSIARMLHRLDDTTAKLREREQAFWHLYHFAPAAMVSVDRQGRIIEANRRAAELFGDAEESALLRRDILELVRPEDRGRLRQAVDRLEYEDVNSCELRIEARGGQRRDVAVDFSAVYDEHGDLWRARLSLLDISQSKKLIRQVSQQRHLMDLMINHLSDAILLISADRKILSANQRAGELLHLNVAELPGHDYDPVDLWARLDLLKPSIFEQRVAMLLEQPQQSFQEQFESRDGSYLFQIVPVLDEQRALVAHLWIVQDFSAQMRGKRLIDQHETQLRALRRVGRRLHSSEGIDQTLQRVVNDLNEVFQVEAIGLVLRWREGGQRNRQLLWLDGHMTPLRQGRNLRQVISENLMPQVISSRSTTFFTDLQQYGAWGKAMWDSGLETLAATPIYSRNQTQGILWIARRGGRPIDDYHLHLLEALAPLLATAIENASLREQMRRNHLCDPVTDLPSARLLPEMIAQMVNRPGHPWSIIALDLDCFRPFNEKVGHAAADQALHRVAQTLRDTLRSGDHIVRYKNDRFVLVCPDIELHHAADLADRLCKAIAALDLLDDPRDPAHLTCSIGVAGSPSDHNEGDTLQIALSRMEAAKAAGRNRVIATNPARSPAVKP